MAYFENVVKTGKCAQFIISIADGKDIGTIFIKNIDHKNHNGEYGIFIGEESARGKGYARFATKEILKYGFEELNLHRIHLTVMADNISAIKSYKNSGFVVEGILRDAYLKDDKFIDILMMSILKSDWEARC